MSTEAITVTMPDPARRSENSQATLVPLTDEARAALDGESALSLDHFPFKVGRESRYPNSIARHMIDIERRLGIHAQLNDVYLFEPPSLHGFHVSREHITIECVDGVCFLIDRNSACGTLVTGQQIGRDRSGGRTELKDGDVIILGTADSPYQYRFERTAGQRSPPAS